MVPRPYRPLCILLALAAVAHGQTPSAEEVQDLRNQLKAAQDRKNQLATENGKLKEQVAALDKKVADQAEKLTASESRSYYLRQHYAAWQQFLDDNPALRQAWITYFFVESGPTDRTADLLGDRQWPFTIDE